MFGYTPNLSRRKIIGFGLTLSALCVMGVEGYLDYKDNKHIDITTRDPYTGEYISKTKLDSVVNTITDFFNSNNDSIKIEYSYTILIKKREWGVEGISDDFIYDQFKDYQTSCFKYLETF